MIIFNQKLKKNGNHTRLSKAWQTFLHIFFQMSDAVCALLTLHTGTSTAPVYAVSLAVPVVTCQVICTLPKQDEDTNANKYVETCHVRKRTNKYDFQLYYECKGAGKRRRIVFSKFPFDSREEATRYALLSRRWIMERIGYDADVDVAKNCREDYKKWIVNVKKNHTQEKR